MRQKTSSHVEAKRKGSPTRAIHLLAKRGWISLAQLALLIDRSYQGVFNRKQNGKIPVVQVNGINRIYTEQLFELLSEGLYKDLELLHTIKAYLAKHEENSNA